MESLEFSDTFFDHSFWLLVGIFQPAGKNTPGIV
jgi:hypothetical protein